MCLLKLYFKMRFDSLFDAGFKSRSDATGRSGRLTTLNTEFYLINEHKSIEIHIPAK